MIRRNRTRRKTDKALCALLRRPVATWFAVLVLVVQVIGFAAAPAAASPEQRAAALSAAIGEQVSLCAQGEHSGAPDQSCPCCGDCALCGLACCAAPALVERVAALLAPERAPPASFPTEDEAAARPPILVPAARPRAPPVPA
jgi:hypothetical protein